MHLIFHIHLNTNKNGIEVQDESSSKCNVRVIKYTHFWRMIIILQVSILGETQTRKMLPKKEFFYSFLL